MSPYPEGPPDFALVLKSRGIAALAVHLEQQEAMLEVGGILDKDTSSIQTGCIPLRNVHGCDYGSKAVLTYEASCGSFC